MWQQKGRKIVGWNRKKEGWNRKKEGWRLWYDEADKKMMNSYEEKYLILVKGWKKQDSDPIFSSKVQVLCLRKRIFKVFVKSIYYELKLEKWLSDIYKILHFYKMMIWMNCITIYFNVLTL